MRPFGRGDCFYCRRHFTAVKPRARARLLRCQHAHPAGGRHAWQQTPLYTHFCPTSHRETGRSESPRPAQVTRSKDVWHSLCSLPNIVTPGPPSKQLSCGAGRAPAVKEPGASGLRWLLLVQCSRGSSPRLPPSLDHPPHDESRPGRAQGCPGALCMQWLLSKTQKLSEKVKGQALWSQPCSPVK